MKGTTSRTGWATPDAKADGVTVHDQLAKDKEVVKMVLLLTGSVEGAKRYGVVMSADHTGDEKKTTALRAKMAKQRGKVKMFDRGGDIAELKKRCKKKGSGGVKARVACCAACAKV